MVIALASPARAAVNKAGALALAWLPACHASQPLAHSVSSYPRGREGLPFQSKSPAWPNRAAAIAGARRSAAQRGTVKAWHHRRHTAGGRRRACGRIARSASAPARTRPRLRSASAAAARVPHWPVRLPARPRCAGPLRFRSRCQSTCSGRPPDTERDERHRCHEDAAHDPCSPVAHAGVLHEEVVSKDSFSAARARAPHRRQSPWPAARTRARGCEQSWALTHPAVALPGKSRHGYGRMMLLPCPHLWRESNVP